uniref:DNA-directed RNA polymerase subunit n=1 Tax=Pithovirus LCPAC406 TaxID=2506599 RepID=A0A481ZH98_9VIRU|nr:MAG: DNA-directed RNA polymerase subunit alpha [Pithovirus LCPAC406]
MSRLKPLDRSVRLRGEISLEDESKFYSFDVTTNTENFIGHNIEANLPTVEIDSFVQTIYDFEELKRIALVISGPGEKGDDTVNSRFLGVTDNSIKCHKCSKNNLKCDGHLGLIEFATPINHPFALEKGIITNVLRSVCNSCACPMLSEKEMLANELLRERKNVTRGDFPYLITRPPDKHLKKMADFASKKEICRCRGKCWNEQVEECKNIESKEMEGERPEYRIAKPRCDVNPQIEKSEPRRKTSHDNWNTGEIQFKYKSDKSRVWPIMTSESILKIFNCISDYTATLLGFTHGSHPKHLIMRGLPVIPPCARPPVGFNETRTENSLTFNYRTIIKLNERLKILSLPVKPGVDKKKALGGLSEFEETLTKLKTRVRDLMLQTETQKTSGHDTTTSIKTIITGKYGILRRYMMGKRVNFSARTVLSNNPHIDVDEISIPRIFAETLTREITVTHDNISHVKDMLRQGKIKTFKHKGGTRKRVTNQHKVTIRVGDKIERPLQEGDYVIFTRQPVLHRFGFMAHKVRFWDTYTFGIHISVTPPYGADFDGDEGTIHIPRSDEAFLEMKNIMSIRQCILGDKDNRPIIAMIYDAPVAAFKLTNSKRPKRIYRHLFNLLMNEIKTTNTKHLLSKAMETDQMIDDNLFKLLMDEIKSATLRSLLMAAFEGSKMVDLRLFDILMNEATSVNVQDLLSRAITEGILAEPEKFLKERLKMSSLSIMMEREQEDKKEYPIPDFIIDAISLTNLEVERDLEKSKGIINLKYTHIIGDLEIKIKDLGKKIGSPKPLIPGLKGLQSFQRYEPPFSNVEILGFKNRIEIEKKNKKNELAEAIKEIYDTRDREIEVMIDISINRGNISPLPEKFYPLSLRKRLGLANMKVPGRVVFSALLPTDMWYSSADVLIENGILKKGAITSKHIGSVSGSIVHELALDYKYDEDVVVKFISDGTRLLSKFISNEGMSVGIGDCIPEADPEELRRKRREEISRVNTLVSEEMWKPVNNPIEEARRERRIASHVASLKNVSIEHIGEDNNLKLMYESGGKGTIFNMTQIMDAPGQQFVNGMRLPLGLLDKKRCIPYFDYDEVIPSSRGFCENGFLVGMSPSESFFAHAGSRNNLMDTAIKTADIGTLQRKLAKALQDIKVYIDGTIRDSSGKIYQFVYGDDGLNPKELIKNSFCQGPIPLPLNIKRFIDKLNTKGAKVHKMTNDNVDTILDSIEPIRCVIQDMSDSFTKAMKKTIRDHLVGSKFRTDDVNKYISELTDDFRKMFQKAKINPGTMVGVRAAQSIGEPIIQLALSSFHQAGSARNITSGIDAIKEFITATPPKSPSIKIIFDPYKVKLGVVDNKILPQTSLNFPTTNDLFILRRQFVHITIKSLILDYQTKQFKGYEKWHNDFFMISGEQKNRDDPKWFMTLTMDITKMLNYDITSYDIVKAFMNDKTPMLTVIPSPMFMGMIDLFPNTNQLLASNFGEGEDNVLMFLEKTTVENLSKITISGIPGIKEAYPAEESVILGIMKEIQTQTKNIWRIWYNKGHMNIAGISREHIIHLFNVSGFIITDENNDWIDVEQENKIELVMEDKPSTPLEYIKFLISEDTKVEEEFNIRQLKIDIKDISDIEEYPHLPVLEASRFKYLETDGSNLLRVISMDSISKRSTRTSNLHETLSTLGVEALRSAFIQMFVQTLTMEGAYVDIHHITLLADYVTHMGAFDPVSFQGMKKHKASMIDTASLEQANDHISIVSIFGNRDLIASVSTAIAVGTLAEIGEYYNISKEEVKAAEDVDLVDLSDLNEAFEDLDQADFSDIFSGEAIPDEIEFKGESVDKPVVVSRIRHIDEEAILRKFEIDEFEEFDFGVETMLEDIPEEETIYSDFMLNAIHEVIENKDLGTME